VEVEGGTLRSVNGPITFSGTARNPAATVPPLGQHTDEVLKALSERSGERSR
jgi:crotonobetainyl-CoA:carnitine CoA-transferase CaiB-like acyl-CoA transferase